MIRKTLMLGLSASALAVGLAAPVSAQMQDPNDRQTGCGVNQNTCTVTQTAGNGNSSTVNIVTGSDNTLTVVQTGNNNSSTVTLRGNSSTVSHVQAGTFDTATTDIIGNQNETSINQDVDSSLNAATIRLNGSDSVASIQQGGTTAGNNRNGASIVSMGNNNRASASIAQGVFATGSGTAAATANNSAAINLGGAATGGTLAQRTQFATINQSENGNSATLLIRGGSTVNAGTAGDGRQFGLISQFNRLFERAPTNIDDVPAAPGAVNNPRTNNVADVAMTSAGNTVIALQDGLQNNSRISINRGVAQAAAGVAGTASDVSGRDGGNYVEAFQAGFGNTFTASVGGRDAAGQQGLGNTLLLRQGTVSGAVADRGNNHSASVFQFGQLSDLFVSQFDNTATVSGTGRQGASVADVSQSSFYSSLSLEQFGTNQARLSQGGPGSVNNTLRVRQADLGSIAGGSSGGGGGAFDPPVTGSPTAARNFVQVTQAGGALGDAIGSNAAGTGGADRGNRVNINQSSVNASATVFQRNGSAGARTFLAQGSAGDLSGPPEGDSTFLAASAAAVTNATGLNQNLTANVDQGGRGVVAIRQDGANLQANVLQNSTNNLAIAPLAARSIANVSQVGQNQSSTIDQQGRWSRATVDQRNGSAAGSSNRLASTVQITQRNPNGAGNAAGTAGVVTVTAIARQVGTGTGTSEVGAGGTPGSTGAGSPTGPAGDADARPAGSFGNQIVINQTNGAPNQTTAATLYAEAEQRGVGQLARITQSGFNNSARILQTETATNAIAIINQSGTGNAFTITQDQNNQFLRVTQTGVSNQNVITGAGLGGGGTQGGTPTFTQTPAAPGFVIAP